jgi:hypothetical protein
VDPVPDPLLLGKPGSDENLTRTFGSVARNSDHSRRLSFATYSQLIFYNDISSYKGRPILLDKSEYSPDLTDHRRQLTPFLFAKAN